MAGDEVEVVAVGGHSDAQGAAGHRRDRVAVVVDLDGVELVGKGADLLDRADRKARQEADADRVPGLEHGRCLDVPVAVQARDEIRQRLRVTDLLHGEHVRLHRRDHRGEPVELLVVDRLGLGPEVAVGAKQVLEIPRRDDNQCGPLVSAG